MHAHWDKFAQDFLFVFPYVSYGDAPSACAWTPDKDIETLGQNFRRAEQPYTAEIERAVREFFKTGRAPTLSAEAAYFAGIRSATIESFVMHLGLPAHADVRTIFLKPPDVTDRECGEWLFLDWWRHHGAVLATQMRIVDGSLGV